MKIEIDIATLKYSVKFYLATGQILDLSLLYTAMSYGDDKGSLAQKASITIANTKTELGYLSDSIKLLTHIRIYANQKEVFRGAVWEWSYTSAQQKELTVTAYDGLIYTTQSKADQYFTDGVTTKEMIEHICSEWEIPLVYEWESITHSKTVFSHCQISSMFTSILEEAQSKSQTNYVMLMIEDTLYVKAKGSNPDVYVLNTNNVIQTQDALSMSGLVTQVVITGKENKEGHQPIDYVEKGKTEYGILQEIIVKDKNATLAQAQAEAWKILKERGTPKETIRVKSADVPFLRKGDKIKLTAGNLSGVFFVEGVMHNGAEKTMELELERKGAV